LTRSLARLPSRSEIQAERWRRTQRDRDGLFAGIERLLGFTIARHPSPGCPEHRAPLDFLADLYFGQVQRAIGLAARGGGKTRLVSILEWLVACRDKTWMFHAGGVEEQAKRAYSYVQEYVGLPAFAGMVASSLMSETRWANGSRLEVHSATINQVSGAHPRLKVADEVEMWDPAVLEKFWGMGTGEGVQTVLISTRDQAVGLMQMLLDEAPKRQLAVYSWCIWDVKQPCPDCLKGGCELWDQCQGKHQHSSGHRPRLDLVDKFLSVDRDTWEAQYLCKRPGQAGLCFPDFVSEPGSPEHSNVTEAAEFDPQYSVELWCDDNVVLPRAILFVQEDGSGRLRVFEEYYRAGYLQASSVATAVERLTELGKFPPEKAVVPADAAALRLAFTQADVDVAVPRDYRRREGASILAQRIRTASGQRALLIHPRCTATIHSLRIAYRPLIAPGVYGDEPAKHAEDHAQDACCYGTWVHRWSS